MTSSFTVRPLGPSIGAEVLELDCASLLLPETLAALEAVLTKHEAVVLHVPELTPEQHLAVALHFGEPEFTPFIPIWAKGLSRSL